MVTMSGIETSLLATVGLVFGLVFNVLERAVEEFTLFTASAAAHDEDVQQSNEDGAEGEEKAKAPIDQETPVLEVWLEDGLTPNEHSRRESEAEQAEPSTESIRRINHRGTVQRRERIENCKLQNESCGCSLPNDLCKSPHNLLCFSIIDRECWPGFVTRSARQRSIFMRSRPATRSIIA